MADSNKSALELLAELRKERDELTLVIKSLEKRIGTQSALAASESAKHGTIPRVSLDSDSIPVGFFHNMSQAAAAEKLLRLNPYRALTTGEILEAFAKSGVVNSKNAPTILYTALKRNPAKFERVAGKAWGLTEWYPEKRKRKENEEDDSETTVKQVKVSTFD